MRAAIWARVSTDDQDTGNQLAELRAWAHRRGLDVVHEYILDGTSAWKGQHRDQLAQALADARTGSYDVLLVWALDRLSREGVEATLGLLRRFHAAGAPVWSLREPWTETADPGISALLPGRGLYHADDRTGRSASVCSRPCGHHHGGASHTCPSAMQSPSHSVTMQEG